MIKPILITLRHVQSREVVLHAPEDRLGQGISPNVDDTPIFPRFFHTCVATGLTLCLTRATYWKKEVPNEAQDDGMSGDASSSL
jgi:hypothetical protein